MDIVIDLGATNIRVASSQNARLDEVIKRRTDRSGQALGLESQILEMIREISKDNPISSIGVSVCGPVIPGSLICGGFPQLGLGPFDFSFLTRTYNCPVAVVNDANAACFYEATMGAGREFRKVLFVTLSTGIGGGLCVNGKIYAGHQGKSIEIGKTVTTGQLEATCSGLSLARRFGDQGVADFFAKGGHELDQWISNLGLHLTNLVYTIDPDVLVLGGGIMKSAQHFLSQLKMTIINSINKVYSYDLPIIPGHQIDDAPLLGMALIGGRQDIYL